MQNDKEATTFLKVEVCSAAGGGRPLAERVYLTLLADGRPVLPEFLLVGSPAPPGRVFEPGATDTFVHRLPAADGAVSTAKLRYRVGGTALCD